MGAQLGIEGSLANIMGGIVGIVLFTHLGAYIQKFFVKKYPQYFNRKFTRTNRMLITIKHKFGLGGVAVLTPIFLSIPVGVLFALTFTHDKRKVVITMIISLLFWAAVLFVPYFLFNINLVDMLGKLFE